jgi:hypothetical protein
MIVARVIMLVVLWFHPGTTTPEVKIEVSTEESCPDEAKTIMTNAYFDNETVDAFCIGREVQIPGENA